MSRVFSPRKFGGPRAFLVTSENVFTGDAFGSKAEAEREASCWYLGKVVEMTAPAADQRVVTVEQLRRFASAISGGAPKLETFKEITALILVKP